MTESVGGNYTKKNFSLLMAETGISTFATSLFTVLILWISITETKSALITGVTSAMLVAPLILSIVVGAFIDKARNKKIFAIFGPVLKALATGILLIVIQNNSLISDSIFLFISALAFGFSIDLLVPVRAIWSQKFLRKPIYLKGMSVANLVSRTSRLTGFLVSAVLFTMDFKDRHYNHLDLVFRIPSANSIYRYLQRYDYWKGNVKGSDERWHSIYG